MSKMLFSSSPLVMGILEDIEICKIKEKYHDYLLERDTLDLIDSIRQKGLLHPILVRPKDGYYEIIAGNRRFKACKNIGWRKILCHILEVDDKEAFELSLIENIQRRSISVIEEATAFKDYILRFGWGGISDLAKRVGKSISYVDKRLRLLDLPCDIIDSILKSKLKPSTVEELLPITDKKKQSTIAKLAYRNNLSSRQVRELVRSTDNDPVYDYDASVQSSITIDQINHRTQRSFNKSIIAIRMAMNKLSSIIEDNENNWMVYEVLMQHKNMLHLQLDILIKEKMKLLS